MLRRRLRMSGGGDGLFSCTVNEIGPAADGAETPEPVIYVNLTDTTVGISSTLTRTYDVAGVTLVIQMTPSTSNNQAIIGVFGA